MPQAREKTKTRQQATVQIRDRPQTGSCRGDRSKSTGGLGRGESGAHASSPVYRAPWENQTAASAAAGPKRKRSLSSRLPPSAAPTPLTAVSRRPFGRARPSGLSPHCGMSSLLPLPHLKPQTPVST